jgi:hypothetical protein
VVFGVVSMEVVSVEEGAIEEEKQVFEKKLQRKIKTTFVARSWLLYHIKMDNSM